MPKRKNTRGAQGDGTIRYREVEKRWEARYTLGVDPGTGKQVQKSVYGKTQDDVRKKLKAITAEIDRGMYMEPSKLTVGKWLDTWITDYNSDVKPTTLDQYKYQIRVHLKPGLGAVKLSELTAPMVQRLYNSRSKTYKITQKMCNGKEKTIEKPGLSPKSIRNMNSVLHEALDKALKLGYVRVNVCNAVTLPKMNKVEMHPVTGDHVKDLLKVIKGNPYEELLYITMFTGMRQGEVLGLTWDCIDFDKGIVTIYRQLQKERIRGGKYKFVSLKNDKRRSFIVADDVLNALKRVRGKQSENKLKLGDKWENKEGYVFTNEFGKHLSKATVYENFKRCAEKADIPVTRFHDLRHTYATLALEQRADIKTVSANLGHATVAFTLDVYGHVSEQMQRDTANRMQEYLKAL